MKSHLLLLAAIVSTAAFAADPASESVATYTVTGTLRTPTGANATANNVPVKYIRVMVMDEDLVFDDTAATVYTTAAGTFSATWTDIIESPDVFINVEYVATGVDSQFVETRLVYTDADPVLDVNIEGLVHNDIPPGTLALGTLNVFSTRANIGSQVGDAVRNLKAAYGTWTMPESINVEGRTTNGASFVAADGSYMSIAFEDYDHPGAGVAAFSDMHHETFHWVAYRAYGNRWPTPNCSPGIHNSQLESCEGFAMQEGSAQYFGVSSALPDNKTGPPAATDWRGSDGTGSDNSGEIVEGALQLTWLAIGDLTGTLQVLLTDAPDSIREFKDAYITDKGATAAASLTLLNQCAIYGIVYTRGRIAGFAEMDPPDATPPDDGNYKIIRMVATLRGEIKPTLEQLSRADLLLGANSTIIAADQKDLGYKLAAAGLAEASTAGFAYAGAVAFGSDLTWDTSTVVDNDYDLIARLRNAHTWVDTFLPSFTGDSNALTNSNEKWLKTQRTWFNQDTTPTTDDEGKVLIDNTPPVVTNTKPN